MQNLVTPICFPFLLMLMNVDIWLSDPSMSKWVMIRTLARTEGWLAGILLFVNINSWVIGALAALHIYLISKSMLFSFLFTSTLSLLHIFEFTCAYRHIFSTFKIGVATGKDRVSPFYLDLTTNELFNWRRYDYLRDERGKYSNPYDKGLVGNWREFLTGSRASVV